MVELQPQVTVMGGGVKLEQNQAPEELQESQTKREYRLLLLGRRQIRPQGILTARG
jgi:hypothetical protein